MHGLDKHNKCLLKGVLAMTPEENLLDRALVKALIEGLKKPNA
jgi:hypothetical protein